MGYDGICSAKLQNAEYARIVAVRHKAEAFEIKGRGCDIQAEEPHPNFVPGGRNSLLIYALSLKLQRYAAVLSTCKSIHYDAGADCFRLSAPCELPIGREAGISWTINVCLWF